MPIALAEWRVRIGRFVRRKPVQVDFEKIIETVLERRKRILQKIDDLLENTRENAAKQEAESKCGKNPGPSTVSESRNESYPNTVLTSHLDCTNSDRKSDDQCQLASTESRDAGPPVPLKEPGESDVPAPPVIPSSSSSYSASSGPDRQGSKDVSPQRTDTCQQYKLQRRGKYLILAKTYTHTISTMCESSQRQLQTNGIVYCLKKMCLL